jgi:hypothetical protein
MWEYVFYFWLHMWGSVGPVLHFWHSPVAQSCAAFLAQSSALSGRGCYGRLAVDRWVAPVLHGFDKAVCQHRQCTWMLAHEHVHAPGCHIGSVGILRCHVPRYVELGGLQL